MKPRSQPAFDLRAVLVTLALLPVLGCAATPGPGAPTPAAVSNKPELPSRRPPTPPLDPGVPLDLDLEAGQEWSTSMVIPTDSYVLVLVEQRGLDVRVGAADSAGHEVAHCDGSGGIGVDERLAMRLSRGSYVLSLRAAADGPTSGRVRVWLETLRPWQEDDPRRLELEALGQEAAHLDGSSAEADWQRSLDLSKREVAGWQALGELDAVIRVLNRITSLERALGRLEQSIAHGRKAVALSVEIGDRRAEAASRYWLAQSLIRNDEVDRGTDEFDVALTAARSVGDLRLEGRVLNLQARLLQRQGRLSEAATLYQEALDRRLEARDMRGVAAILNNLALIAHVGGRFADALGYYRESVEAWTDQGRPGRSLTTLSNMADLFYARGQWQEALTTYSEGLATAVRIGDSRSESTLGAALARLLFKLGEPDRARDLLARALEIERLRRDAYSQVTILSTLGWIEAFEGDLSEAEAHLEEALELCLESSLRTRELAVLRALANFRLRRGAADEALALLGRASDNPAFDEHPIFRAQILYERSEAHLQLDALDEAHRDLGQAVTALDDLAVPEIRFEIAFQEARVRYRQGEPVRALMAAGFALDILESIRSSVDDPDQRATFLSRVREAYDFTVQVALELEAANEGDHYGRLAFETLERAKARSLIDLLAQARGGADRSIDSALLERERSSLAAVNLAQQRLDAALVNATEDQAELDLLRVTLAAARDQLAADERAIRIAAPQYASLRYPTPISVEAVQARLTAGVALVEYSVRPSGATAFVLTADSFATVELPGTEDLEKSILQLRSGLEQPARRAFGRLLESARRLGETLVDPVLPMLEAQHRWIVAPDGPLHYIPFEALRIEHDDADERYLIEQHALSYVPSAGVMLSLENGGGRRTVGHEVFVALANPTSPAVPERLRALGIDAWPDLPGARREVETVARALGSEGGHVFTEGAATESLIKSHPAVAQAQWLHLAAHAMIDEETPANSSVVLTPDEPAEDGYLRVSEVFELELDAELVVLSGCETALGRQIRGEGLIGLTRAFLFAGSRSVQVSLWKVSDATTPALMSSFYRSLRGGSDVPGALRQAKLESLAEPGRAHPFHWAPFIVVGAGT